jgi:hypothetical protein
MQRAELAVLVAAGILLLQQLEQRLGLELRRRLQPGLDSGQCSSNGSGRVRQLRGCFRSDDGLPTATYGLASRGTEP